MIANVGNDLLTFQIARWSFDCSKYQGKYNLRYAVLVDFSCLTEVPENVNLRVQQTFTAEIAVPNAVFSRSRVKFNGAKHSPPACQSGGPFGQKWLILHFTLHLWLSLWFDYWYDSQCRKWYFDISDSMMKLWLQQVWRKIRFKTCSSSRF